MQISRLSGLLTVLAVVFTALAVLFTITGTWLFLEHLIVSAIALVACLSFSFKDTLTTQQVVSPYILSIVVLLILNTCRYSSDFHLFIGSHYHSLFLQDFSLNYINWFLFFVCLPVSVLLLGGYFLTKRSAVGPYFVWWGFVYCITEAVIQFKIELGNIEFYKHSYFSGSFLAMALFVLGVKGILYLIKPIEKNETKTSNYRTLSNRQVNLWSAFFVSIVAVYGITVYVQAGFLPVGIIVGSMMGGMIGWRKTTARFAADPYKLTPLYLLLLTLFYIHVGEETLTNFSQSISSITGIPWKDKDFNYLITLLGPVVWVFAAHSLWKGGAAGNFILWFLIVGMILGEPTHLLVFPVVRMFKEGVGYQYFSGMYTALFPMIPAILALVTIIKDHRAKKPATENA